MRPQMQQAKVLGEPGGGGPQMIPKQEGFEGFNPGQRQRLDSGIGSGLKKEGDRKALAIHRHHPMLGRFDLTAGPALQKSAKIDGQAAFFGWHINPFIKTVFSLQAEAARDRRQKGQQPGVDMFAAGGFKGGGDR